MMTSRKRILFCLVATAATLTLALGAARSDDLANVPMERLVIDDMEDVSDWYNGSPDETKLAASELHTIQGKSALEFANVVDHTKGEKNYPIGWPRSGKDLKKLGLTDWSDYEYFECWIYVTTSRDSLPKSPLGVGFYHSGPRRTTSFRLAEVRKDEWVKISIPISKIELSGDVQRVQFNISESDYAHGDQVNFYIDDMVLTRFAHPVIGSMAPRRRLVYASERHFTAQFELLGNRSGREVEVVLEIGRGEEIHTRVSGTAGDLQGEITLELESNRPLTPSESWVRLSLQDESGKRLHTRQATFRVIKGPF